MKKFPAIMYRNRSSEISPANAMYPIAMPTKYKIPKNAAAPTHGSP